MADSTVPVGMRLPIPMKRGNRALGVLAQDKAMQQQPQNGWGSPTIKPDRKRAVAVWFTGRGYFYLPEFRIRTEAIILRRDRKSRGRGQGFKLEEISPNGRSMACARGRASLGAGRIDPCGNTMDRPADHCGPHGTPLAGLD